MKKNFKKTYVHVIVLLYIVSISINCYASSTPNFNNDSLASDFKYFCKILEETHPDPYSGFGGRPYFYLKRDAYLERILKDSLGLTDFCDIINEFIVPLQDMHTYVSYPDLDDVINKYVQGFLFLPLNEGLIVRRVPYNHEYLLGSRLFSIGGEHVDTLLRRMLKIAPSENKYGNIYNLASRIIQERYLNRLGVKNKDSIQYGFITSMIDTVYIDLPLVERPLLNNENLVTLSTKLKIPENNLQYTFLDNDNNIMYLKLSSIMARENYKYSYENGWRNAKDDIKKYYNTRGIEMPDNIDDAILEIPSFSEEFANMLENMKNKGAEYLIIDLRSNGGGWTPITIPSLIMMFGDDYISKDMEGKFITRISDNYLKKSNISLEDFNKLRDSDFDIGDYVALNETNTEADLDTRRNNIIQDAMTEKRDLLNSLSGKPSYSPKQIFVITDMSTFSAAFHYAFYLWKMGATIVGVPSRQSPNSFMETTPFQLPFTKLSASSSNSLQQFVETGSIMEKALIPEIEITLDDYKTYNFDANTPVLKIIDILSHLFQN